MTNPAAPHDALCPNCRKHPSHHRPWCATYQTATEPPKVGDLVVDPVLGPTPLLSVYTRSEAIEDGELVDCTVEPFETLNRNASLIFDVAVTRVVFERYIQVPPAFETSQDLKGRYWDILTMFRHAIRRNPDSTTLLFEFICIPCGQGYWRNEKSGPTLEYRKVQLKAECHPGDRLEPCITFMLPEED
jgi:hypothetical protein